MKDEERQVEIPLETSRRGRERRVHPGQGEQEELKGNKNKENKWGEFSQITKKPRPPRAQMVCRCAAGI